MRTVEDNPTPAQQVSQPTRSSQQVTQDEPKEVETSTRTGPQPSIASLLTVAAQIAEEHPSATSSVDDADRIKIKSLKKVSTEVVPKKLKPLEASRIKCPITKYPTAIRMQKVEGFLVNLEERKKHLGSRSNACKTKTLCVDNFKPEHVYNAAFPEMPKPKEKRFEAEYSESAQKANKTSFDDMSFVEKSKSWNTAFSCRVRITGLRGLDRLVKLLDRAVFTYNEYQCIFDQRFVTIGMSHLFTNSRSSMFAPRELKSSC